MIAALLQAFLKAVRTSSSEDRTARIIITCLTILAIVAGGMGIALSIENSVPTFDKTIDRLLIELPSLIA